MTLAFICYLQLLMNLSENVENGRRKQGLNLVSFWIQREFSPLIFQTLKAKWLKQPTVM